MTLTLPSQPDFVRTESDPSAIETLKRKGWVEIPTPDPGPSEPYVPETVPFWAFRAVLDLAGLTSQVDAIVAGLPGEAGAVARSQWEFATIAVRSNATVTAIADQLGLSAAQVDALFIQADQIATNQP